MDGDTLLSAAQLVKPTRRGGIRNVVESDIDNGSRFDPGPLLLVLWGIPSVAIAADSRGTAKHGDHPVYATQILSVGEVKEVLEDLRRRAKRSRNNRQNLIVFRLSSGCGLRCKEICGLDIGDITVGGSRPCVKVRKQITKGEEDKRKTRIVPLWWDAGTLADLTEWVQMRREHGAGDDDPVVCSQANGNAGRRLIESQAAKRWKTAIRCLGPDRVSQLSIHSGRHSFCSHALAAGRSLVEVRDAAGHSNVSTTSIYLHVVDRPDCRDLFG